MDSKFTSQYISSRNNNEHMSTPHLYMRHDTKGSVKRTNKVADSMFREHVAYRKPDQYNREATGWTVGGNTYHATVEDANGDPLRVYHVAVLWSDGVVTVEDTRDLITL